MSAPKRLRFTFHAPTKKYVGHYATTLTTYVHDDIEDDDDLGLYYESDLYEEEEERKRNRRYKRIPLPTAICW